METKTRHFFAPFTLKAQDDGARTFEGESSVFTLDETKDIIHPGSYKRTLDHWKASGRVIPLMDYHSYKLNPSHSVTQHTLGKMVDAEERGDALWTRFQIAKTRAGDDLQALLRDGMVEGLSVGFKPIVAGRDEKGVRHIRELQLLEVSVVTFGAHPDALVDLASVKALVDALKDGSLTTEQEDEIRQLPDEQKSRLRALLETAPAQEDDDFGVRAQEMLDRLRLGRLATAL